MDKMVELRVREIELLQDLLQEYASKVECQMELFDAWELVAKLEESK